MRKNREKILRLTITAILTALIFVLAFTPIGYVKIGPLSISFLSIPVAVGAILGGTYVSTFLGLMFGITSLLQCFGMEPFGTALFTANPFYATVMCIVPRVLMGLFCGLIYSGISKTGKKKTAFLVTSFGSGFINTVLFVGFMILLFYRTGELAALGDSIIAIITALVTVNALVEWVAATLIGTTVSFAVDKALKSSK